MQEGIAMRGVTKAKKKQAIAPIDQYKLKVKSYMSEMNDSESMQSREFGPSNYPTEPS